MFQTDRITGHSDNLDARRRISPDAGQARQENNDGDQQQILGLT